VLAPGAALGAVGSGAAGKVSFSVGQGTSTVPGRRRLMIRPVSSR